MAEIVEKDLSHVVNGCIFDVHNEIGPGLREECYQKAMELRLAEESVVFTGKPQTRRELMYCGEIADVFEPNLANEDRMIVELKTRKGSLPTADFRQTINYLKYWGHELGTLVNSRFEASPLDSTQSR